MPRPTGGPLRPPKYTGKTTCGTEWARIVVDVQAVALVVSGCAGNRLVPLVAETSPPPPCRSDHGYNTSFGEAVLRAAQLTRDLPFAGVPVLFSWPSRRHRRHRWRGDRDVLARSAAVTCRPTMPGI